MSHELQFYIDGAWVAPLGTATLDVIDPSTEEAYTKIAMGTAEDVNRAVAAAKAAFPSYSQTSREERIALLKKIAEVYQTRYQDIAQAISREMGAPTQLAMQAQAGADRRRAA
jgi:aldehyde dehydrogenase (NAD+)